MGIGDLTSPHLRCVMVVGTASASNVSAATCGAFVGGFAGLTVFLLDLGPLSYGTLRPLLAFLDFAARCLRLFGRLDAFLACDLSVLARVGLRADTALASRRALGWLLCTC